ncbi:Purine permease 3 [Sesamum alatum]|uniref:Purine permease 3 n=1 Tax=Sesamum alatum TaxID=300844 RepID=A0AAE2CMX8_9LAMI|nr:Purine permease 3 [Sesamum alatum]
MRDENYRPSHVFQPAGKPDPLAVVEEVEAHDQRTATVADGQYYAVDHQEDLFAVAPVPSRKPIGTGAAAIRTFLIINCISNPSATVAVLGPCFSNSSRRQEDLIFQLAENLQMACNSHSPHRLLHALPQGRPQAKLILMKPRLFPTTAVIKTLTDFNDYLYTYGVAKLPVSTAALIIPSKLAFTTCSRTSS